MTYETFKQSILSLLAERVAPDIRVEVRPVCKNNNLLYDGLSILAPSANISPTIYLNQCYEMAKEGSSLDEVADYILSFFEEFGQEQHMDVTFLEEFSRVKEHVIYKLVNLSQNEALLADIPFLPYLDLAIVFCLLLPEEMRPKGADASYNATILIHNEQLSRWNIGPKELLSAARHNTSRLLPPRLMPMQDLVEKMQASNLLDESMEGVICPMCVLSNTRQFLGAAVILYQGLLQKCADLLECDLVVLPSSIHEVLLLPYDSPDQLEQFSKVVDEVNETCVEAEEVLSDHAYYYCRSTQQLHCAAGSL